MLIEEYRIRKDVCSSRRAVKGVGVGVLSDYPEIACGEEGHGAGGGTQDEL